MRNNVKEVRQERQLTQAQLAEIVGVSRQTIISIEISKYVPSVLLAIKLANALEKMLKIYFRWNSLTENPYMVSAKLPEGIICGNIPIPDLRTSLDIFHFHP